MKVIELLTFSLVVKRIMEMAKNNVVLMWIKAGVFIETLLF